jgi:hypothetical protein
MEDIRPPLIADWILARGASAFGIGITDNPEHGKHHRYTKKIEVPLRGLKSPLPRLSQHRC